MRKQSGLILFNVAVHFLKRLSFLNYLFWHRLIVHVSVSFQIFLFCSISGFSILFHLNYVSDLCQYHTVLITVALQCSFRLGSVIILALFFFLKIDLSTQDLLCFHTNFRSFLFQFCEKKNAMGILIRIALNMKIALDFVIILIILILPIHENDICFHLFLLSSVSFISVLVFQVQVFYLLSYIYSQSFYSFLCNFKWDCFLNFSF